MAVKVANDRTNLVKHALENQLESALYIIGQKMEGYAKMKCPVDTSRLKNSISNAYDVDERKVVVGTNVEYASYVELGRANPDAGKHGGTPPAGKKNPAHIPGHNPQPFLKPAVEEHLQEYKRIAIMELSK